MAYLFNLLGSVVITSFNVHVIKLNSIEAFRPENSFSDAVKGLHLYGAKVIRPEALVDIIAQKP